MDPRLLSFFLVCAIRYQYPSYTRVLRSLVRDRDMSGRLGARVHGLCGLKSTEAPPKPDRWAQTYITGILTAKQHVPRNIFS